MRYPLVAQVSNLPYRRLPVGRPSGIRQAGGLKTRDTADWKSALQGVQNSELDAALAVLRMRRLGVLSGKPSTHSPRFPNLYDIGLSHFGIREHTTTRNHKQIIGSGYGLALTR